MIGYELKGDRKRSKSIDPPMYYAGVDEALAYLVNPVSSPSSPTFAGSIFDEVWLVHPAGSAIPQMADLISKLTPLGLMTLSHKAVDVVVRARPNPYLDEKLKAEFLDHLDAFDTYRRFKVKPIQ